MKPLAITRADARFGWQWQSCYCSSSLTGDKLRHRAEPHPKEGVMREQMIERLPSELRELAIETFGFVPAEWFENWPTDDFCRQYEFWLRARGATTWAAAVKAARAIKTGGECRKALAEYAYEKAYGDSLKKGSLWPKAQEAAQAAWAEVAG